MGGTFSKTSKTLAILSRLLIHCSIDHEPIAPPIRHDFTFSDGIWQLLCTVGEAYPQIYIGRIRVKGEPRTRQQNIIFCGGKLAYNSED